MVGSQNHLEQESFDSATMPFVAPCNKLDTWAAFRWIRLGWQDLKRAKKQSLLYGVVMMLISYIVTFAAWSMGSYMMLFALLSGFFFIGPVLAIGLYSISCQLQEGKQPHLGYCLREGRRHIGNGLVFAFILLIVFLIWARAASMVHIFFPEQAHPALNELIVFLSVGTTVGAFFSMIIFTVSAFSLPMIMDRKVDVITAVVTSINAVLHNKAAMLVWVSIIVLSMLIGFLTAYIGLIVLLPLIGHATWYGYRETVNADSWPRYDDIDSELAD